MKEYFQYCAAIFIALILTLILNSKGKEFGVLLSVCVCALVGVGIAQYLKPVVEFISQLGAMGEAGNSSLKILLKGAGIGFISEIGSIICSDSGCGGLGKLLQLLGTVMVLWLSLPLFTMMMELLQAMMGGL